MNKKMILIASGIVIVLLLITGGGYYVLSGRNAKQTPTPDITQAIPTLTPSDLGMTLVSSKGGKAVTLNITKLAGITGIDFELSYTSKGNIPRGAIGHIDITSKDASISREILLGTCSNVCHYDEDVSDIKIVLKIQKSDGKTYEANTSL